MMTGCLRTTKTCRICIMGLKRFISKIIKKSGTLSIYKGRVRVRSEGEREFGKERGRERDREIIQEQFSFSPVEIFFLDFLFV